MRIRLSQGEERLFGWTNRNDGYLRLSSGSLCPEGDTGFFLRGKRLLSDFHVALDEAPDLYRINARHTDVLPEGVAFAFAEGRTPGDADLLLEVSLLLGEPALYFRLSGSIAATGIALIFPDAAGDSSWRRSERDGCVVYSDGSGRAISAGIPFALERISPFTLSCVPERASVRASFEVYVAFGEDSVENALALAKERAIDAHRKGISAFQDSFSVDSGDHAFDESLKWAHYTAWMHLPNAFAPMCGAVPTFRDRCLFLIDYAIPCGQVKDARDAILVLAGMLDRNPESPAYGYFRDCGIASQANVTENAVATADSTSIFIRCVWEYLETTGDRSILDDTAECIDLIVDAAIERRCDQYGFLLHGSDDTWMRGGMVRRGDRACEVEAQWFTALCVASRMARILGDASRAERLDALSKKLEDSFLRLFWDEKDSVLADYLPPGPRGDGLGDFRVRPNQLYAITASLLDAEQSRRILDAVNRELVSSFGLFTLCPDDPLFHPRLEDPERYSSEAARYNGTIAPAVTWQYLAAVGDAFRLNAIDEGAFQYRDALLVNTARMIHASGFAGSLPLYIDATPGETGEPVAHGLAPDVPGTAGILRSVIKDIIGFRPSLTNDALFLEPALPSGMRFLSARVPFGYGSILEICIARNAEGGYSCTALARQSGDSDPSRAARPTNQLTINGVPIEEGRPCSFIVPGKTASVSAQVSFPAHDLAPAWCGAIHCVSYLERLLEAHSVPLAKGDLLMGEDSYTAELAWFFDSDYFRRRYVTDVPGGAFCDRQQTVFRLWAPTARVVTLYLYTDGGTGSVSPSQRLSEAQSQAIAILPLNRRKDADGKEGMWEAVCSGDLHGLYYDYRVQVHGLMRHTADPCARAAGINGVRSMVVDFTRTNPAGWDDATAPAVDSANDVVAYELHVADLIASPAWNGDESLRRTYAGAACRGTAFDGVPTGFDHIKSLGVTHVQLLPVFDFASVDERRTKDRAYREQLVGGLFNWGYDPACFSVPEGSYSADPAHGALRVRELKTLIRELNSEGIGVIMDVVYNHVPSSRLHPLARVVPGYYFRIERFSGAGDDTASEREMFRSWMVQSLSWWLSEYRLSGFRFDLMGLHDVVTMNAVADSLRRIKGDVLLYGEGWDMYRGTDRGKRFVCASMLAARRLSGIGFFNDAFRCAIKGSAFGASSPGFIHDGSNIESVKFGLVGAVYHPQVHNRLVTGTANPNPWTDETGASVNYTEIHDNMTLYDKLVLVEPGKDEAWYERLQKTAISLVLLAQGMPVLHAGMEFMRTKEIPSDLLAMHPDLGDLFRTADGKRAFSHNSYNLADLINALDWRRCAEKRELVAYVRRLIALRREHPLFRLRTDSEVALSLAFVPEVARGETGSSILAWVINAFATVDPWQSVFVVVNAGTTSVKVTLPRASGGGAWHLVTDGVYFAPDGKPASDAALPPDSVVPIAAKALYLYAEF